MTYRGARRASLTATAALLALAGTLAACGRGTDLAPVTAVHVRSTDLAAALGEAGIDAAATAETAEVALAAAGFRVDEGARRGYRATIEVVAVSAAPPRGGAPAAAEVVLDISMEQTWASGPVARRTGKGRAPLTGAQRRGAWQEALRQASVEAASALALDLKALRKSPEQLVADLAAADPRVRERAVRALASKGARGAAKALAALVRDRDPTVAAAAIEAVSAFKDPASAVALIDAAQGGDVAMTLRLIPVLVEIGGPDVEGYLLTLEAGHGDRGVRRAAGEALARFRARRPARGDSR